MIMTTKFRKSPPVCLAVSLVRLAIGKLSLTDLYLDETVLMKDNSEYKIFRHITTTDFEHDAESTVFIVSFKFARLSHKANQKASIIPMLLIAGFPGFVKKIYAVNPENGYWQGMYQWKSSKYLEEYKQSFVFRIMNKRAIPGSIDSFVIENENLTNFIEGCMLKSI
jgi:hypothetical protein